MARVLWIEDQTETDLNEMFADAVGAGHALTIVGDATQAVDLLASQSFDIVIVDARIDPGDDPSWYNHYYDECRGLKSVARLGIQLLRVLWNVDPTVKLEVEVPCWFLRERVGVLTVEPLQSELKRDLDDLGIPESHYKLKSGEGDQRQRLRHLIETIEHDLAEEAENHAG